MKWVNKTLLLHSSLGITALHIICVGFYLKSDESQSRQEKANRCAKSKQLNCFA